MAKTRFGCGVTQDDDVLIHIAPEGMPTITMVIPEDDAQTLYDALGDMLGFLRRQREEQESPEPLVVDDVGLPNAVDRCLDAVRAAESPEARTAALVELAKEVGDGQKAGDTAAAAQGD